MVRTTWQLLRNQGFCTTFNLLIRIRQHCMNQRTVTQTSLPSQSCESVVRNSFPNYFILAK